MFCLGLLDNLVDLIIPFDTRLIILGIFDPVLRSKYTLSSLRDVISLGIPDGFGAKSIFTVLIYCKLPQRLDVCVIQKWILPRYPDLHVLAVWTEMT